MRISKVLVLLTCLSLFPSCLVSTGKKQSSSGSSSSGDIRTDSSGQENNTVVVGNLLAPGSIEPPLSLKTFNQYGRSLSSITGISESNSEISSEFEAIKTALPSDHETEGFSAFHQVAFTRLSFAYCSVFVDGSDLLDGSPSNNEVATNLLKKLIGKDSIDKGLYDNMHSNVLEILENKVSSESSEKLIVNATGDELKTNLLITACSAVLASSHFTLIGK